MPESNVIDDVRAAKRELDARTSTLQSHGEHLAAVERDFRARSGAFATVPLTRPDWVQRLIDSAVDAPGDETLSDLRPAS